MKPNGTRARAHDEGLTLDRQSAVALIAAGATDTAAWGVARRRARGRTRP